MDNSGNASNASNARSFEIGRSPELIMYTNSSRHCSISAARLTLPSTFAMNRLNSLFVGYLLFIIAESNVSLIVSQWFRSYNPHASLWLFVIHALCSRVGSLKISETHNES